MNTNLINFTNVFSSGITRKYMKFSHSDCKNTKKCILTTGNFNNTCKYKFVGKVCQILLRVRILYLQLKCFTFPLSHIIIYISI